MICPNKTSPEFIKLAKDLQDNYKVSEALSSDMAKLAFYRNGKLPTSAEAIDILNLSSHPLTSKSVRESVYDIMYGLKTGREEGTLAGEMAQGREMAKKMSDFKKQSDKEIAELKLKVTLGKAKQSELKAKIKQVEYESAILQDQAGLAGEMAGMRIGRGEGVLAEKDLQKEFAAKVKEYLETNEKLKGRLNDRQITAITNKAAKIGTSDIALHKFMQYTDKVIKNANYAEDLNKATALKKDLKNPFANAADIIKRMKNLDLSRLTHEKLLEFKSLVEYYKKSKLAVTAKRNETFDVKKAEEILKGLEEEVSKDLIAEVENAYGVLGLSEQEAIEMRDFLNAEDKEGFDTNLSEAKKKTLRYNLVRVANYALEGLKAKLDAEKGSRVGVYVRRSISPKQRRQGVQFRVDINSKNVEYLNEVMNVDLAKLTNKEISELVNVSNNVVVNNSTANLWNVTAVVKAVKGLEILKAESENIKKFTPGILVKSYYNSSMILKAIFGNPKFIAKFRAYTGYDGVLKGFSQGENAITGKNGLLKRYDAFNKSIKLKDNAQNSIINSVYSTLIDVRNKSIDADFKANKQQVRLSIDEMLKSGDKDTQTAAELLDSLYKVNIEGIDTHQEFMDSFKQAFPENVKSVEFMINEYKGISADYRDYSISAKNKNFDISDRDYYTPKFYTRIREIVEASDPNAPNKEVKKIGKTPFDTGRTNERYLYGELPKNKVLDLSNFKSNILTEFGDVVSEMNAFIGEATINKISSGERNVEFAEILGGDKNAITFIKDYESTLELLKYGKQAVDELNKMAGARFAESVRQAGTIAALAANVGQFVKQTTPSISSFILNPIYFAKSLRILPKALNSLKLLEQATISVREQEQVTASGAAKIGSLRRSRFSNKWTDSMSGITKVRANAGKISMASLGYMDNQVAKRTWVSFYMKYMNESGVKVELKDLDTEHERLDDLRREAISYASQQTDVVNAPSKREVGSKFMRESADLPSKLVKNMLLPFNSFASNIRSKMLDDWHKLIMGDFTQKGIALRSILASSAEAITYNAIKLYAIKTIYIQYGLKPLIASMFDINQDDENFEEVIANKFKDFYTNITRDLVFSGAGSFLDNGAIDGINYLISRKMGVQYTDYIKEDPFFKPSYTPRKQGDDIKKAVATFATYVGGYGIVVGKGLTAYTNIQEGVEKSANADYTYKKSIYKNKVYKGKMTFDMVAQAELQQNQADMIKWLGIMEAFSLMTNITDNDLTSAAESLKIDILKEQTPKKKAGTLGGKQMNQSLKTKSLK